MNVEIKVYEDVFELEKSKHPLMFDFVFYFSKMDSFTTRSQRVIEILKEKIEPENIIITPFKEVVVNTNQKHFLDVAIIKRNNGEKNKRENKTLSKVLDENNMRLNQTNVDTSGILFIKFFCGYFVNISHASTGSRLAEEYASMLMTRNLGSRGHMVLGHSFEQDKYIYYISKATLGFKGAVQNLLEKKKTKDSFITVDLRIEPIENKVNAQKLKIKEYHTLENGRFLLTFNARGILDLEKLELSKDKDNGNPRWKHYNFYPDKLYNSFTTSVVPEEFVNNKDKLVNAYSSAGVSVLFFPKDEKKRSIFYKKHDNMRYQDSLNLIEQKEALSGKEQVVQQFEDKRLSKASRKKQKDLENLIIEVRFDAKKLEETRTRLKILESQLTGGIPFPKIEIPKKPGSVYSVYELLTTENGRQIIREREESNNG